MAYLVMFGLIALSFYLFILGISVAKVEAERNEALRTLETVMRSTQQATLSSQRKARTRLPGFWLILLMALTLVAGHLYYSF